MSNLVGLPGRLWGWLTWLVRLMRARSGQRTSASSSSPWILRGWPILALGLLLLATYRVIPRQTSFEPFDIFTTAPQQRILVVHDSTDSYGEKVYSNAGQALAYARLSYDELDLAGGKAWPQLSQYSSLLFSTEFLEKIDPAQAQRITNYVADGGGLVVIYRGWNPDLAPLFGMEVGPERPVLIENEGGLQFQTEFFPGVGGLVLSQEVALGHVPYAVQVQPQVEVLATSFTDRPIAWLHRYEQGRTLFWNTAILAEKDTRGFIVQSVLNVQRLSVLPIVNLATIQIDNFPAAQATEKLEPVKSEYDLRPAEFYDQIWLPDMLKIARRYELDYTFLLSFTDNERSESPFDFEAWERARIELDGQEILASIHAAHQSSQTGELGLHGYNHVPLTMENWSNRANMVAGLQAVSQRWEADDLGRLPVTYVPPENRYDKSGAQALTEGLPSLKVISGLYNGGLFAEGGNREFGPEPWNPELFTMPRATSGYNMSAGQRLATISELGTMGVWTHFLHPDDVFDTPQNYPDASEHRNPQSWFWRGDHIGEQNGFYYRFLRWLNFVQTHYPWLRYVQTGEAYEIMQSHLGNEITVSLKPYELWLETTTAPTFFQVRINDGRRIKLKTLSAQGIQFIHIEHGEGYTIYTLRALRKRGQLELLIPKALEE